jgi:uncharacterized protein YbaR (Trm112 family)
MSNLFVERKNSLAPLQYKTDWQKLENQGDYAFTETFGLPVLVMRCPFCDSEAPYPPLARKVLKKNPLTLEGSVHCGNCRAAFTIREGVAFGISGI